MAEIKELDIGGYGNDEENSSFVSKEEMEATIKKYEEILSRIEDKNSEKAKMFMESIEYLKGVMQSIYPD